MLITRFIYIAISSEEILRALLVRDIVTQSMITESFQKLFPNNPEIERDERSASVQAPNIRSTIFFNQDDKVEWERAMEEAMARPSKATYESDEEFSRDCTRNTSSSSSSSSSSSDRSRSFPSYSRFRSHRKKNKKAMKTKHDQRRHYSSSSSTSSASNSSKSS